MDVAAQLSRHNQLDAYWLSEAERRGLEEKLIQGWETDLAEVKPESWTSASPATLPRCIACRG